jgi:hypothetical protein
MTGSLAGGGWLAVQLIINPGAVGWLAWVIPNWDQTAFTKDNAPQRLTQIQARATKAGLFLGDPLPLGNTRDLVIPVSSQRPPCRGVEAIAASDRCGAISELRVYRPYSALGQQGLFQLTDRLAVPGLREDFILNPADDADDLQGSSQIVPFTTIHTIEGKPPQQGIWFLVSGLWVKGEQQFFYGQVMGYDTRRGRLETRLQWATLSNPPPSWQRLTSTGPTALVVNQTLGLEPHFQVYQVRVTSARAMPQLDAVSLTTPAIRTSAYTDALALAQARLWTPALQRLQALRDRHWPAIAQTQMQVIQLHADVTQAQARQAWASPTDQITALIINGQWSAALQRLGKAVRDGYDLTALLRDDSRTIGRRVEAALRVDPAQTDIQAWGMLTQAAQRGRRAALLWLQAQRIKAGVSKGAIAVLPTPLQEAINLLNRLSGTDSLADHPTRLVGEASLRNTIRSADWVVPQVDQPLVKDETQSWYQIRVMRFHDGQRWWRSPFDRLNLPVLGMANEVWDQMGLSSNSQIQINFWSVDHQLQTVSATVKAIRVQNGVIDLLATGEPIPKSALTANLPLHLLATTTDTWHWLEPTTTTLDQLNQQQPVWASAIATTLWQTLQASGQVPSNVKPDLTSILTVIGSWPLQLADLTGNGQPEAIVTYQPNHLTPPSPSSPSPSPFFSEPTKTLIFSDRGRLIYDELGSDAGDTMQAIADFADGGPPVLIIEDTRSYQLKQWSSTRQQFE